MLPLCLVTLLDYIDYSDNSSVISEHLMCQALCFLYHYCDCVASHVYMRKWYQQLHNCLAQGLKGNDVGASMLT